MNRLIAGGWLIVGILHTLSAIQYTPFDGSVDPSECALVLNQYSDANLLANNYPFGAPPTCITYDAVDQAYLEARKRIQIKTPPADTSDVVWPAEHTAKVGELLLDISTQLAKTYGMGSDDIEKGLPLIDTSKTLIREICPAYLSDVQCHAGKYRRHDGLCNNLDNPTWGAINTPFTRLMAPHFADGMNQPRESITGNNLPLPRIVSRTIHPDEGYHDHAGTVMIVAWGQFMDHDFTLTATPLDRHTKNEPEECCNRPAHLRHPYCMDVVIPEDDYFYKKYGVKCQDFVRSFPAPRPGCRLGSKVPFNTLTGVIDGNTVYGVTEQFSRHLRSGYSGLLRMNPVFSEFGLKELLPLKLDIPEEGCTRANGSEYCFEAGEIRVNEQLVLACMHTIMAREHNRIAKELAKINPHWDDETLYQEARRIVIAEIQHITFNEFLPIVLGKEVMEKFGLVLEKEGYWDGYDQNINPNIIDAFSAAAFRFGHSLLPTAVERWSKAHKFIASKRLSDLIRRPYDLYRAGVMDEYLMGLMNQVAQAMDDSITQEVTNHLLKKPGHHFGLDLVAFNMQRGREFGVPGYMYFRAHAGWAPMVHYELQDGSICRNWAIPYFTISKGISNLLFGCMLGDKITVMFYDYRKFCGLPAYENFEDLFGSMPNSTVHRYQSIFQSTMDVDLWSGGVSEKPLPGSLIGSTFACVIATQMSYIRRGDRFWYELPNQPSSFTPEQLQEIRKIKLSRVLCDNTDLIDTIQVYPMVLPDYEINPRVPCKSGILPKIDLTKWAEYDPSGEVEAALIVDDAHEEDGEKFTDEEQTSDKEEDEEKFKDESQQENDVLDDVKVPEKEEVREEENEDHNADDNEQSRGNEEEEEDEDEESQLDNDDENHEPAVEERPPPRITDSSIPPSSSIEKTHNNAKPGTMTRAVPLGTFNTTKVYIPVFVPQKHVKHGKNKTQTIKSEGKKLNVTGDLAVSSVVKASSKLEIKNTKVRPLKYDENFTILVAKKNKVMESAKGNDTKSKKDLRRKRRAPSSSEHDSGSRQYSEESEESEEHDSGSSDIRDADHDYDSDYEYVRPDELKSSGENGPSGEAEPSRPSRPSDTSEQSDVSGPSGPSAPDAYDIHGYRGEQKTTHWPPKSQVQPAYAMAEGKPQGPHMKSRQPQTFRKPLRDYGSGHHRHPGGATSSSSFNMGSDEHHHHHFYDKLKETHENKPKDYHHTTKFLIPPEVYRKYPGKHKHFHHVKTPGGQKVIEESEEDDPNFDPSTLTDKDHEEAFQTYDEEEVAVDVNYYDEGNRSPRPQKTHKHTTVKSSLRHHPTKDNDHFKRKHMVKYRNSGGMTGSQNKAEVERIFDAVERAMRKENLAMKSSQSMTIAPTGSAIMWPLGFPRGLDLKPDP